MLEKFGEVWRSLEKQMRNYGRCFLYYFQLCPRKELPHPPRPITREAGYEIPLTTLPGFSFYHKPPLLLSLVLKGVARTSLKQPGCDLSGPDFVHPEGCQVGRTGSD